MTKEEFKKAWQGLVSTLPSSVFRSSDIFPYATMVNCENCTGDFLENAKDCHMCFVGKDIENCRYSSQIREAKDCWDYDDFGRVAERVYDSNCCGRIYG